MDQTDFSHNQESLQAPPEIEKANAKKATQKKPLPKKWLIIGGLVISFFVVLLMLLVLLSPASGPIPVVVTTPNPVPTAKPANTFRDRLLEIETKINQSDPSKIDVDPPVVNLEFVQKRN